MSGAKDSSDSSGPPGAAAPAQAEAPGGSGATSGATPAPDQAQSGAGPAGESAQADQPSPLWLRRSDQVVLAALSALCLVLMTWYLAQLSGWRRDPIELRHMPQRQVEYRIDINTADWVEFSQLPRIGRTLAERIVEDRDANGPFSSIDDLQRVGGIGPKTVARIREYLAEKSAKALEKNEPPMDADTRR